MGALPHDSLEYPNIWLFDLLVFKLGVVSYILFTFFPKMSISLQIYQG
jgi:hypothetical protein